MGSLWKFLSISKMINCSGISVDIYTEIKCCIFQEVGKVRYQYGRKNLYWHHMLVQTLISHADSSYSDQSTYCKGDPHTYCGPHIELAEGKSKLDNSLEKYNELAISPSRGECYNPISHNPPDIQSNLKPFSNAYLVHTLISLFRKHTDHLPKSYTLLDPNEFPPHPNMCDISMEESWWVPVSDDSDWTPMK